MTEALGTSEGLLQCGRGWTLQNTALYAEIKPPTQTPHRQRPRPGVSPARRRTTAQRPGPGGLGPRGAGHVGRAALAAMSLQGLGRTGPAPGRALECAGGRPTDRLTHLPTGKGGRKAYIVRGGIKRRKLIRTIT